MKAQQLVVYLGLCGFILYACQPASSVIDANPISQTAISGSTPLLSIATAESTSQQAVLNTTIPPSATSSSPKVSVYHNGDSISLPSKPEIAPSDVIQQIAWTAQGGGNDCTANCLFVEQGSKELQFSKFSPEETIIIDVYRLVDSTLLSYSGSFLAEYQAQVEDDGTLNLFFDQLVRDQSSNLLQFIIRNEARAELARYPGNIKTSDQGACPGTLKSRIKTGMKARVTFTNGTPTRIRSKPLRDKSTWLADLPEGTKMQVVDGPRCIDGWVWWKVETENGYKGWVSEGDQVTWFIEPIR
jgi:hypothetical protein